VGRYQAQKKRLKDKFGTEVIELRDEQAGLAACVAPQHGAELSSLKLRWRGKWLELLYRGNDFSPIKGWQGRAPLLWPAVGRNYTPKQLAQIAKSGRDERMGTYQIGKQTYSMPTHGFAMNKPWHRWGLGPFDKSAWVMCDLTPDAETLSYYPFRFTVGALCSLAHGRLRLEYIVRADESNSDAMPSCIGNHITLNFPFTGRGKTADGLLRMSARKQLLITPQSLLSGKAVAVKATRGMPLGCGRFYNAVFGGCPQGQYWVELREPGAFGLRIEQREVIVPPATKPKTRSDHFLFVFYGDPQKKLICPEPWVGGPNSLNTGERLVRLKPGESFTWEMTVKLLGIT